MNATLTVPTRETIESCARDLLDALDRMHGRRDLSLNVRIAADALRMQIPRHRDPRDLSPPDA